MFKRIFHIPFAAWLGAAALFGMFGGNELFNRCLVSKSPASIELECKLPANYCDASIASLEYELKVAFRNIDECEEEMELWNTRAEQIKTFVIESHRTIETCIDNLEICTEALNECIDTINGK